MQGTSGTNLIYRFAGTIISSQGELSVLKITLWGAKVLIEGHARPIMLGVECERENILGGET